MDLSAQIMGLSTRSGRRIFMSAAVKHWSLVISGTSLTLSVQRLTCYSGLLPTSNKLSSFLHLSWGSLVSCVWQAACLQVRFQPREGSASSRGKLSSFCQTTGKRRSLSLPLGLSPSICLSLSACSLGTDLHFPTACNAPLSLAVQNKQAGVRRLKRQASPRSLSCCVNPLTVGSWGPQQPSQYASCEWHRDRILDWGEIHSMLSSLGRDEHLYCWGDAHHFT